VIEATAVDNPIDDPAEIEDVPEPVAALFDRIDVGYYRADAAEISSLELDKVAGVEAALDVLDVRDPFLLVMGDSKSDLRVMGGLPSTTRGSPRRRNASADVLSHVLDRDELVFGRGQSATILRTVYVLNLLAQLE